MKNTLQLFCLGLFMVTLSSCDTYVNGGGYAGTRPGYYNRPPSYHPGYNHNHGSPTYYHSRPAPRSAGVGARVNTRGLPLNVNSNTRLGIF
jgi:hypothetical protein